MRKIGESGDSARRARIVFGLRLREKGRRRHFVLQENDPVLYKSKRYARRAATSMETIPALARK